MADKNNSKFGAGLVIGAIIGGATAFLLSPKNGKENRKLLGKKIKEFQDSLADTEIQENVKNIFGDVTDEGMKMYKSARKDLAARLEDVKDKLEEFDHDKYISMVDDVLDDVKGQMKTSSKHIDSLKGYLLENWNALTEIQEDKKSDKKKSKKKS